MQWISWAFLMWGALSGESEQKQKGSWPQNQTNKTQKGSDKQGGGAMQRQQLFVGLLVWTIDFNKSSIQY